MLNDFIKLWSYFLDVPSTLRKADEGNWKEANDKIMLIFSQTIDPLRASFESKLIEDAEKYMMKNMLVAFKNSLLCWMKAIRK